MEQQIKLLKAVEDTLENVEVRGSENMDRMLGCIRVLQSIRANLIKLDKEMNENAPKHEGECVAAETATDRVCGT